MVFVASRHPLWRVLRRSMQLLAGAAMMTAVLSSGPTFTAAAALPVTTTAVTTTPVASVTVNPVLERESTSIYAEPAHHTVHVARAEQPAPVALATAGNLSGRILAAALGERAPPRL